MTELLQQMQDVGFWSYRFDEERATWSAAQWSILGQPPELPPLTHEEFLARVHPADRASCAEFLDWTHARNGATRALVFRFDALARGERWIASHYQPMKDFRGGTIGMQGFNRDVTDEIGHWHEALASRVVLREMPSGVALVSGEGEIVYVNDRLCRILQRERARIVGTRLPFDFWAPEEVSAGTVQVEALLRGNTPPGPIRRVVLLPDGTRRHVELTFAKLSPDGRKGFVANIVDVTDRVGIEARLATSEARLRGAFEAAGIGMAINVAAIPALIMDANARLGEILGVPVAELIGTEWQRLNDPSEMPEIHRLLGEMQRGERRHYARVGRLICPSGRIIQAEIYCAVIPGPDGKPSHYMTQVIDITERLATEQRLQEMVLRFRQVTETIDDVFWISDRDIQRGIYVSPGFEKIWGRPVADFYSNPKIFFDAVHPDDRDSVLRVLALQEHGLPFGHEYRIVRPDGEQRWILDKGYPVVEADGRIRTYVGVARDISAEKRLRESVDQAQRLEAIGQLTGELAHDFNNLLSIVMMNAIQAQRRIGADEKLRRQLDTIVATATRGGQVTKALLAVSRRQNLKPELCSLDALIEASRGLIETSAGPTTELRIHGSDGRAMAEVDPVAFSNALLNLVINARDAMPGGGILTIALTVEQLAVADPSLAAADLPAGAYAVVEVADTGTGMTPEILARVWEPFFTTKELGRGSGLGLPAVYGFARQSRGTAVVSSEPGLGTRVKLIIPQAEGVTAASPAAPRQMMRKGWGRILLVDDEPDLLEVMAETLDQLGYTVSVAGSGDEALRLLQTQSFDLLLTDVAMRRMSGIELARRVHEMRPDMKILLMSGFAAAAIPSELPWRVLEKPVSNDELAAALSAILLPPSMNKREPRTRAERD